MSIRGCGGGVVAWSCFSGRVNPEPGGGEQKKGGQNVVKTRQLSSLRRSEQDEQEM